MIRISRTDNRVTVVMETGIGYEVTLNYDRHCSMDAELLKRQLLKSKEDFISAIKERSYNEGWNDKLKKRMKQKHFHGFFFK